MAGNGKSGLGWVILAAALAVPGFLFYNWWSHLKAEREKAVSQKARGRVPDGGVFQQSSPDGKLVNPIASSTATVNPANPANPAAPAPAVVPVAVVTPAPAPAPAIITPPPAAAATPAPAPAPAPTPEAIAAPIPAATEAPPEVSSAPATLTLKRDPMISPFDIVRMQQAELERQLERERLINAAKPAKQRRVTEPPIESTLELQGIVSNPDGENKAIVNGEVVGVGESIGRARPVRVVKITSVGVTFLYKGRRFVKSVNNE